jgi:hypothetical protein
MSEEIHFGNYSILDATAHHFELEPSWEWKIKPVHSGMELEMSKFTTHNRLVMGPDGIRRELPPTWMEICYREIAMTFGGTNIPKNREKPLSEGGESILVEGAPIDEIEAVLRKMPQPMVMEIWTAVGETYPKWGPADPKSL